MKIDKNKFFIEMARSCMTTKDLYNAGISQSTYRRLMKGDDVKPKTIGIIAKALGSDVIDIIVSE